MILELMGYYINIHIITYKFVGWLRERNPTKTLLISITDFKLDDEVPLLAIELE